MKLHEIFAKPIDRPIEGVIKADDLASLKLEVEEYVITNEIGKSLDAFFKAYNNYSGANGVWISGFFGSGKSHLLKMLALLLENQAIAGTPALDYFEPKIHDAMLKGEIRKATRIPSRSILFNIDQKADTISKTEIDAVLAVFVKVFNEMQGYYGKHGYVAQFERDLDRRGVYGEFKAAFARISGNPWERGRETTAIEKMNIARAFAEVTGEDAQAQRNIIDAYREDYRLSIEDFAEQVNEYILNQGEHFRLNFFVDEVGQYIAENIKLMTNLQTIAESLATKCGGRSWLIVTAQEDLQRVFGDTGKQQSTDFSKIQARFKTRMKLTSQNVDEVIQKRLLQKNDLGDSLASQLYRAERNNFGTLFDFTDGATRYRGYADEKHFAACYPFVPYQFTLFQSAIETLSQHNAFEGKHSSVGERSMLEVFQQVAIRIAEQEGGALATFDAMFEGIRATLKSQIQGAILKAENHLGNPFAVRVLKALFLVKYVKGFNATPRNLRVLLQDHFDSDLPALRKEIDAALALLEQQTYIQRNGEVYEYLTDEEKDVEQEIKNTEVDSKEVSDTLDDLLFTEIIRDRKLRYDETGQDYPFTKKLDDRISGREQEITIHFVTPFSENVENFHVLQANSMGRAELMVVMPANARFVQDMLLYKKTDKYVRINRSTTQQEPVLMILNNKGFQNQERFRQVQAQARELVASAQFFVGGTKVEIGGEDPKSRIVKGFNELIVRTYSNLRMLRGTNFNEIDIRRQYEFGRTAMLDSDLTEPEQEIFSMIEANRKVGTRTTLKSLVDHFTSRPYGWHLAAVQCLAAMLAGRGKLLVRSDANILEGADLERALKNTHGFGNLILEPQPVISGAQLRKLKDFHNQFFDRITNTQEPRLVGSEVREGFRTVLGELRELAARRHEYPFLAALDGPIREIQDAAGKDYTYFLEEMPGRADEFLNMKEDVLDPIRRFMNGPNRTLYDEASEFLRAQHANFDAVGDGKPARLREILSAPDCFKGSGMRDAKSLVDELRREIEARLVEEREQAGERLAELQEQMRAIPDYEKLSADQRGQIERDFEYVAQHIRSQPIIPLVRERMARYEADEHNDLLNRVTRWAGGGEKESIEYVHQRDLGVRIDLLYLATEEDVEAYLAVLKEAMLAAIRDNKRIRY